MPPGDTNTAKTRKPHRKSRKGCVPCKSRHVKCDEQKPTCLNCEKYGSNCRYPQAKGAFPSHVAISPGTLDFPTFASTPSESSAGPTYDSIESGQLIADVSNLRLLHYFTTVTAKTLAHEPEVEDIFSCYIPTVAFDNAYLLHALLSLAALHLSQSDSERQDEYLLQAKRHHQIALNKFRNEVKSLTESNLHAVLAFNASVFPYSCAISVCSDSLENAFESICSILLLVRMVGPLLQSSGLYDSMRHSDFGRITPKDVHSVDWSYAEAPIDTELVQLRKFSEVIHHIYPSEIIEAYKEAIRLLELLFEVTRKLQKLPSDSLLRIWIHFVPPRFVELLSERQPGALIIFAHYGVVLGRGRHYWFLEGIDELILAVADAFVPTEWKNWLDWPKDQIRSYHRLYSNPT